MAIPSQKDIELPLLTEIEAAGGEAKPLDLYDRVARHFPQLTAEDRLAEYPASRFNIWRNRVQWARQRLVNKGELDASTRGVWKITNNGRGRLGAVGPPLRQPVPTLSDLLERQKQQVREQLHEILMNLHPQEFEAFGGRLLESSGFTDIEITNYVGDGGIDGYGNLEMGVVKVRAAFQVKRWRQNVPRPEIDRFRGAIQGTYDQGIFITTSDFSDEAKEVSSKPGTVPIVMINGTKILDMMLEKGLGIKQEPLTIIGLDEDFFGSFGVSEQD